MEFLKVGYVKQAETFKKLLLSMAEKNIRVI